MVSLCKNPKISVILPCQNEEEALSFCLQKAKEVIAKNNLSAEIIVSDSSKDKSPNIAKNHGVILVKHDKDGYGTAYLEALKIAKGKYIFMADADGTYEFSEIPNFLKLVEQGCDFVIGNRFSGKIEKGAMPYSHKIGNFFLSFVLRLFFGASIKDSHCGIRMISRQAINKLDLQTRGMEFASEMVIKSIKNNFKIKELPVNYLKRKGKSKLKALPDAWKHMRFMLLYSPMFLFFIPGVLMFLTGALTMIFSPQNNFLLASPLLMISGYQLAIFSLFAKTYSVVHLNEKPGFTEKIYKYITIETASIIGIVAVLAGIILSQNNPLLSLTIATIGVQTVFSSFMLSILGIKK